MNIKPLADRVLVEPKEAETKTASGLFIPDNAKEKPSRGRVIAVGDGLIEDGSLTMEGEYLGYVDTDFISPALLQNYINNYYQHIHSLSKNYFF